MQNYYTVVTVLSIFSMMIIQVCIRKSNTLTRNRKRLFLELFNMIIIASICEWLGNYLQSGGSSTRIIHIVVKAIELSVPYDTCRFGNIIRKIWIYILCRPKQHLYTWQILLDLYDGVSDLHDILHLCGPAQCKKISV